MINSIYPIKLFNNCLRNYKLDTYDSVRDFFTDSPFNYRFDDINGNGLYLINYKNQSDIYEDDSTDYSGMGIALTSVMRGSIFEKGTNRLVCFPIPAFTPRSEFEQIPFERLEFTDAIDGVLVNLYFYDKMWRISTRGRVNAFHSYWRSERSFGEMAAEVLSGFDFSQLNRNYCYGLILEHSDHTNVIHHKNKRLYHIFTRDMNTLQEVDEACIGIPKPRKHTFMSQAFLKVYLTNCKLRNCIGVVARDRWTNRRHVFYTNEYLRMKSLIKNHRDIHDIFIDTYTGIGDSVKNVRYILNHFKKYKTEWKWVLHTYTELIDYIEFYYDQCYKKKKQMEIPKVLKPVIYDIHGIYISRKREWYRIEQLRRLTEVYYRGDIESNPSPKIMRYDIIEWYASQPFEVRRKLLNDFSEEMVYM